MNFPSKETLILIDRYLPDDQFEKIAEQLYATIDRNREHLANLDWAEGATLESTRIYLDSAKYSNEILHAIMINSEAVGMIVLRDKGDHYLIGYWLDKKWCNKGHMKQFVKDLMYRARVYEGISKPIRAQIRPKNIASQMIVLGAGFKLIQADDEWHVFEQETSPDLYS